jgi:hypothetical protein
VNVEIIRTDPCALRRLDELLLDEAGHMRLLPAAVLYDQDPVVLRTWANQRGRYGLPTAELVDWLRDRIAGRKAIEVGAGMGDLGRHLGIKMTDSAVQVEDSALNLYYRSMGQVPTDPPADVIRCDALTAVRRYRPQVVVGCFITQLYRKGDEKTGTGSSVFGVDEGKLLARVGEYIHIGATSVHYGKRILKRAHIEHAFPWLVSRVVEPSTNRIWIWTRP